MIREENIVIRGAKLNYAVHGEGSPIIFLHNGGGFWHSWEHQISHFSRHHTVYALDWPGFGASDPTGGLLSMEVLYDTLSEFILVKKLSEFVLVGNCIGASAAYLYTQRHPKDVRSLILFNICPGDLIFPRFFFRSFIPALNEYPSIKRMSSALLSFMFLRTRLKKKFPPILFGDKYDPNSSLFKRYVEKFKTDRQTNSRVNLLFSVHTYTFQRFLERPEKIPHALIWGAQNKVASYEKHGKFHREMLRPERFELIPDAGHLCMYESPEVVNQIMEEFLNRHSSR